MEYETYLKECFDTLLGYLKYRLTLPSPLAFTLVYEFRPRPQPNSTSANFHCVALNWPDLAQSQPLTNLQIRFTPLPGVNLTEVEDAIRIQLPELNRQKLLSFRVGKDA